VQLRGRVPDELTNTTAENYAAAKFGLAHVTMGTRVVDELPSGWVVRVLAGIEVMSQLSNGSVIVEPTGVTVRGKTGNETAQADISRLLIDKLGQAAEFDIDIEYVKELDPIAGLPTPEECVAKITEVTAVRKITFDPSASSITSDTTAVVNEIADILKRCPDLRIEIAGYTDSQGREIMNEQLSQERATAVLDALRARRVPVSSFAAKGYGEADPIADNGTAEGREANRRIEFRLIVPETAPEEPTALEEAEAPAAE
jgi:OOP family OmpA-OmpF porin